VYNSQAVKSRELFIEQLYKGTGILTQCPTCHLHTFGLKHVQYSMWYYNMNTKGKTLCILLAECCERYNVLCIPEDMITDDSPQEALEVIISSRQEGVHTSNSWLTSWKTYINLDILSNKIHMPQAYSISISSSLEWLSSNKRSTII
jgi:hypothetical protein